MSITPYRIASGPLGAVGGPVTVREQKAAVADQVTVPKPLEARLAVFSGK